MADQNTISIQITAEDLASAVINKVQEATKNAFDKIRDDAAVFAHVGQSIQYAYMSIASIIEPVVDATLQMDVINTRFKTVAGSSELAAKDLDYVRGIADNLGLAFKETAESEALFAGATKNTSLEGAKAKEIFEGLEMGITAMHMSAEKAEGVLIQLSQAIGKNKLTMADWRPILEAFPMLNERFATALGVSTGKLAEMMEAGQLTNTEIAKLGPIMKETFAGDAQNAAHNLQAEINRLKTAIFDTEAEFGEIIKPALAEGIKTVADNIGLITFSAKALIGAGLAVALGKISSATTEVLVADAAAVSAAREIAAAKAAEAQATLAAADAKLIETRAKVAALVAERESLLMAQAHTESALAAESADLQLSVSEERLAAIRAELTIATRAAAIANEQYAAAAANTGIVSEVAAVKTKVYSGALAMFGGPIGLGVAAFAALTYAIKKTGDYFIGGTAEAQKNSDALAKNAEATRKAAADRKAVADAYRAAVGDDLDKQLDQVQKTYEKENRAVLDEMEARRKAAQGNSGELVKIDVDEKNALRKVLDKYHADSAAARAKDRKNLETHYAESLKIAEAYYKATGDSTMVDSLKYKQQLAEEKRAINSYYDQIEADAQGAGTVLVGIEESRNKALLEAEQRHSKDAERVGIDSHARELEHQKAADEAMIAQIKAQIAEHVISEEEGNRKILMIQQQGTQALIEDQKKRVEILEHDKPNSEEYKNAIDALKKLESDYTNEVAEQAKQREKARKDEIDISLTAAKNSYQSDLNDLQQAENDKIISTEDACLRRIKAERDYAEKVVNLRAQELSQFNPETQTKEYQAALAARLDADKKYLDAKQALNEEEAKQVAKQTVEYAEELQKRLEGSRQFASSWFGMWDDAYNNASSSLKSLSDAAYNAFATTYKLPLKTVESLETLKQKAVEASESYINLWHAAQEAGVKAGPALGDAVRNLGVISAEAARISAEFYNQKVAAEELAIAMEKPTNTTEQFALQADGAIDKLKLLDNATLDKLKSSLQKIKDVMQAFTDAVKDGLKSLQDDWDNMSMSKLQLEEKRYQEEKKKWEDDMAKAQAQHNDDAIAALQQQLALINKIHNANTSELKADPANSVIPTITGMAGGGNVGGSGIGDTQLRYLDPREWVIQPEAVSHWGSDIMAALNTPWSRAGQFLADRINGISLPSVSIPAPSFAMAGGGPVREIQTGSPMENHFHIYDPITPEVVRRKIIPEIEKRARLKK